MINIRQDLILAELERDVNEGFIFSYQSLSNRFLDRLFNHYYVEEMCENFYDSEPLEFEGDENEELYHMYMDYMEPKLTGLAFWNVLEKAMEEPSEPVRYSEEEHTPEEIREAYFKVKQIYEDYEPRRIEFNNWQEPYYKGNWDATQYDTDKFSRCCLEEVKKIPIKKKGRLFVGYKDDQIRIYWYGRDFMEKDYWWCFKKRDRRVK